VLHPSDFLYKTEDQRQRERAQWERDEKRAELQEEANRTTIERNRAAIEAHRATEEQRQRQQAERERDEKRAELQEEADRTTAAEARKRAVPSPIGSKMLDDFIRENDIRTKDWPITFGASVPKIREARKGGSLTRAKWAKIAKAIGVPDKTIFPEE
jgi:hypothetical protein